MHRIEPSLDLQPGTVARTLIEGIAIQAAAMTPLPEYGTPHLQMTRELEHIERTMAASLGLPAEALRPPPNRLRELRHINHEVTERLGVNRNGDDFSQTRMGVDALGIPFIQAPLQVSRINPSRPALDARPGDFHESVLSQLTRQTVDSFAASALGHHHRPPGGLLRTVSTPLPPGRFHEERLFMDRDTWRDLHQWAQSDFAGVLPPPVTERVGQGAINPRGLPVPSRHELTRQQEVMAAEDRAIFAALDSAVLNIDPAPGEPRRIRYPLFEIDPNARIPRFDVSTTMDPRDPTLAHFEVTGHGFMVEELPGRVEINPRAVERLRGLPDGRMSEAELQGRQWFPMFEMGPTINLNEVRTRRFNIMNPNFRPVTVPDIPPPKEMTLDEMKKIATVLRRSFWARLLDDEYPY
jgi:hypothetical protein